MSDAHVLLIDDDPTFCRALTLHLEAQGYRVASLDGSGDIRAQALAAGPDVVLLDLNLPQRNGLDVLKELVDSDLGVPVIMVTGTDDVAVAVRSIRAGAFDYVTKPPKIDELSVSIGRALATSKVTRERDLYREITDRRYTFVRSKNPRMNQVYELARKVSGSEMTSVLIQGESGTGKEHVAHLIHEESARARKPFLEINCASLPEHLLESELFGHEKGAFTDASARKRGLLEVADGGTLFLDEVGEMALNIQVKLLRVLERMTFRRVGGTEDIQASVRIISATNRDLAREVKAGKFREDLFFRLKVVPIELPPLRERYEDLPVLMEHFLREFAAAFAKRFEAVGADAIAAAREYRWPGNIRELRNTMERGVLLNEGTELSAEMLQIPGGPMPDEDITEFFTAMRRIQEKGIPDSGVPLEDLVQSMERYLIRLAGEKAGWNQTRAAGYLQLNRDKLRTRLKNYDLGRPE
ncbi:sigma-54 dependent transcriptional regulator [bacterium]|nr:sigma-54 dependent transcriptional regulator [bacterium]